MSDDEKRLLDQETEERESSAGSDAGSADPADIEAGEGDPPIIIQRDGS